MTPRSRRLLAVAVLTVTTGLLAPLTPVAPASSAPPAATAEPTPAQAEGVASRSTVGGLEVENSFVSAVGWVKPGDSYPSRIIVRNPAPAGHRRDGRRDRARRVHDHRHAGRRAPSPTPVDVHLERPGRRRPAPARDARAGEPAATTRRAVHDRVARPLHHRAGHRRRRHQARHQPRPQGHPAGRGVRHRSLRRPPVPGRARHYRDRAYRRPHRPARSTRSSTTRRYEGSTFNLFQEMSLGQLYPDGTVPSAGHRHGRLRPTPPASPSARSQPTASPTCKGVTATAPAHGARHRRRPAYTERITDGVYNLPGTDRVLRLRRQRLRRSPAPSAGVGALQDIDSGCGPTGKLVYDAAAIADPEIDYSDYDTDKDGVVDFFMVVFAGCGGNGASQLSSPAATCRPEPGTPDRPTTTSGRTPRAWSSTTPTRSPGCPASPPTTSSRTSRASRSGTPTTATRR